MPRSPCPAFVVALLVAFLVGLAASPSASADEPAVDAPRFDPPVFSPAWSPGEKDETWLGFRCARALPIGARVRRGEDLLVDVVPGRILGSAGRHMRRFCWNGAVRGGEALPDGDVRFELYTPVSLAWRHRTPERHARDLLRRPHALAVTSDGTVYVASPDGRIRVFDVDGHAVGVLGPRIEGVGRLGWVHALAWDAGEGLLALRRRDLVRIDAATGTGETLLDLRARDVEVDWLDGLAVLPDGRFLLTHDEGRVTVFDRDGTPGRAIGVAEGPGRLTRALDVAAAPDGTICVTDQRPEGSRVVLYAPDGTYTGEIATVYAGGPLPLAFPSRIAALADGTIVVAEGGGAILRPAEPLRLFAHVRRDGEVLHAWGGRGAGEDGFAFPSRLVAAGNVVWVADTYRNHRVQALTPEGERLRVLETPVDRFVEPRVLVALHDGRWAVLDEGMERVSLLGPDGTPLGAWPTWTVAAALPPHLPFEPPLALAVTPEGTLALLSGDRVVEVDAEGSVRGDVRLEGERERTRGAACLTQDASGRLLVSDREPSDGGAVRLYDPGGAFLAALAPTGPAQGPYFGPLVPGSEAGLFQVQQLVDDAEGREGVEVVRLRLGDDTLVREDAVRLARRTGQGVAKAGAFTCGGGRVWKGTSTIACYDLATGAFLWELGSTKREPFYARALHFDGGRLWIASAQTGHVECWDLDAERVLGSAFVEIDNTPPVARLQATDVLVVGGDAPFDLLGSAFDLPDPGHFDRYRVEFRPVPRTDEPGGSWRRVARSDPEHEVRGGTLATWSVHQPYRDRGIEVRVTAWDEAGNASTSEAAPLAFDDDGDGYDNATELEMGSDPRAETVRADDAVSFHVSPSLLLRPYIHAEDEYVLEVETHDVRDPEAPQRLANPLLELTASDGAFAGRGAAADGTTLAARTGRFRWRAPAVAVAEVDGAVVDSTVVEIQVAFPEQVVGNVLYGAADATLLFRVTRDDDHDWMPDGLETTTPDLHPWAPVRGTSDSDADGVGDGHDLAPRTTYRHDWRTVYPPGSLYRTMDFQFVGIGGGGSRVTKDGDEVSSKNILRSERVYTMRGVEAFLNETVFRRNAEDASERDPFAVTGWLGFSQILPEDEVTLNGGEPFFFGGKGHPDYRFTYTTLESEGTAVVTNVDAFDGTQYAEAGIHRNYLQVVAPGSDDGLDRTVRIQWRILRNDRTSYDAGRLRYDRMGWLVEAFRQETAREGGTAADAYFEGQHQCFSGYALAQVTVGNIYEARISIPGELLRRRHPVFLRLTPIWLHRADGSITCLHCDERHGGALDTCPTCGRPLTGRYQLSAVPHAHLRVSGIEVEAADGWLDWRLRRSSSEEDEAAVTDLAAIQDAVATAVETAGGEWPLVDGTLEQTVQVGERSYEVRVTSVRAMDRWPALQNRSEREAKVALRAVWLQDRLDEADAVCIVAGSERWGRAVAREIDWPTAWCEESVSVTDALALGGEADAEEDPSDDAGPLHEAKEAYGTVKGVITTGKKLRGCMKTVARWQRDAPTYDLEAGQSALYKPPLRDVGPYQGANGLLLNDPCITVQRQADGFIVRKSTVVQRAYDTDTGAYGSGSGRKHVLTITEEERVDYLDDSDLIESAQRTPAWKARLKTAGQGLKAGGLVFGASQAVWSFHQDGDAVKLGCTLAKTGVEALELVAELRGWEGELFNGIHLGRTGAAKLGVFGAVTGAIEVGYNVYLITEAKTPLDRQAAVEGTSAALIDGVVGCIEPWGGIAEVTFLLGSKVGELIIWVQGDEVSPITRRASGSIGSFLVFVPLHFLPESVPSSIAQQAAEQAMSSAVGLVETRNAQVDRRRFHLFVPPD